MKPSVEGRRVTITGGSGFLGAAVVRRFEQAGAVVSAPTRAEVDLLSDRRVHQMFEQTRPDVVVHLAAHTGNIEAMRAAPADIFHDTLTMGTQVLRHALAFGADSFVTVCHACAYPKFCPIPFQEDDLWDGFPDEESAPLGLAQRTVAALAQAFSRQHGLDTVVLIPTNLYGPGADVDPDSATVIPSIIRRVEEARRRGRPNVWLWGDGTPTREFLYVDDCAEAVLLATKQCESDIPVNLGNGYEIAVRHLAAMIADLCGYGGHLLWDVERPTGQPRRCLDIRRAADLFGFHATTRLEVGLLRTIEAFRAAQTSGSSDAGEENA